MRTAGTQATSSIGSSTAMNRHDLLMDEAA
jgi:hypothetical protein